MQRRFLFLPLLAPLFLASACAQQQAAQVAPGECLAEPAQFAIGYVFTDALLEEVRHRSGARLARVLRPGDIGTMEFNPERVNLEAGPDNRVVKVRCG